MAVDSHPPVSVVVPVYDDYSRLRTCLEALAEQTYPTGRYEVVVVDNGTPEQRIVDVEGAFECVRLHRETKPGSYAARNAGIDVAGGELFAFTDADCIPTAEWLIAGTAPLVEDRSVGLVGGPIELFARGDDRTAAEIWELREGFPQRHYIEDLDFAATANMFTRRRVFEDVGRFDHELLSGGDREFGERVARAGYRQVFAEGALVRHPARRTLKSLLQKMVRTTRGDYRRRERNGELTPARRLLRMLRAGADLAIGPLRTGWTAATAAGPFAERVKYAAADGLVRATRELVALEQLAPRLPDAPR